MHGKEGKHRAIPVEAASDAVLGRYLAYRAKRFATAALETPPTWSSCRPSWATPLCTHPALLEAIAHDLRDAVRGHRPGGPLGLCGLGAASENSVSCSGAIITIEAVKTIVLGPPPPELEAFIERRRSLGLDGYDEVWEGVYHVVPMARPAHSIVQWALASLLRPYAQAAGLVGAGPFNLGEPNNFRVPDGGYFRLPPPVELHVPSAAIVVEVVSPDDETYEKFDFYARHGVEELIVADPALRQVRWFKRRVADYLEVPEGALLSVTGGHIADAIDWP